MRFETVGLELPQMTLGDHTGPREKIQEQVWDIQRLLAHQITEALTEALQVGDGGLLQPWKWKDREIGGAVKAAVQEEENHA